MPATGARRPAPGAGVIGLGEIGQVHVDGILACADARLVAVTDLDAEVLARTAERSGAQPHASYQELLGDPEVEFVSVCLPHHLHLEVALAAIAAGRDVLVEKPLAMTPAECDEIALAAAAGGRTVGVQHNQIFYPPHARARQLIDEGAIGRPLHIRLRLGIGGKYGGWRADPGAAGGGLLMDAGIHRVYLARHLFGEIAEIRALTDRDPGEGEDQAVLALRFESGALGVIDVNYLGPPGMFDDSVEIVGSAAALYLSGCEADWECFRTGPALRRYDGAWHDERVEPGDWAGSVRASIAAFAASVRSGSPPPVGIEDGRRVVEIVQEARRRAGEEGAAEPGGPRRGGRARVAPEQAGIKRDQDKEMDR